MSGTDTLRRTLSLDELNWFLLEMEFLKARHTGHEDS